MTTDRLDARALNRATLSRQFLLDRADMSPAATVAALVGLQAQNPLDPYSALWSRLAGFEAAQLAELMTTRAVVRIVVMRGTIHLVTADDCLLLRPLMQPVLDAEIVRHSEFAPLLRGVDIAPVLAAARAFFAERPLTGPQLRAALAERFPDLDAAALAYSCRCHLALVQVPPRGVWGKSAQVTLTTAESWLGRPLVERPCIDDVVLRYFGAFGPASVADVSAWCRLKGMREVVERLRPKLRTLKGANGRELFDVDDAVYPGAEIPAPPRFLPEYDNALLSHADRSRFFADDNVVATFNDRPKPCGSVLVDGAVFGAWFLTRDNAGGRATLTIRHARPVSKADAQDITVEGLRFVRFLTDGKASGDVRIERVGAP